MKKKFALTGMISGVLVVLIGLLVAFGAFGHADSYGSSAPYSHDSGFAVFGGDYYTYSVNNGAEAASAAQAAASNARELSGIVQVSLGVFLMAFGIANVCGFGIIYSGIKEVSDSDNSIKPTETYEINVKEEIKEPETSEETEEVNSTEEIKESEEINKPEETKDSEEISTLE